MPSDESERNREARILLVPSTGRDAEAINQVLASVGLACEVFRSLTELCQEMQQGAGALLLAEESLAAGQDHLAACIAAQPIWSDLPVIVLSRAGAESPTLTASLGSLGNVSVLERPVRINTLLSAVQTAIRARSRQYQARDHLSEREYLLNSERAARSQAERAGHIKDEFLATLSHELRTPLNAILGWSQILAIGDSNPDEVQEGVKIIERNARAQAQIIEDLLDMSRIVSGKIRLNLEEVVLAEVLRAALDTVNPAAHARGIHLTFRADPDEGRIAGDPHRLQQIFWNLLSNAVKFTPKDGNVQVLLERVESHISVSVVDSGEGIDPEFMPYIFDRFRQANATTTRQHGGLGLGLAIVKQLAEVHGGSISAHSDGLGQGSTFKVRLPIRAIQQTPALPASDITHPQPTQRPRHEPERSIAGLKVLVVDDEADSRELMRRLLEDKGAIVSVSASASAALHALAGRIPDVLVSDIGMPDEDGYSFIRRVRQLAPQAGGNVPAIALTAYVRPEDRQQALSAGFQHHLTKPVEPAELIAAIAQLNDR